MNQVDVIIPLYNKENTVERAIRSVQRQRYPHWNIIVVDDGSTDGGPDLIRCMQDSRIRMIQQPNQGPGAARNTGIRASGAPYIAFLDADDQWYPSYLENVVGAMQSNPVSLVGTMYEEWPRQQDMTRHWQRRGAKPGIYHLTGKEPPLLAEALMLFFHVDTTLVRAEVAEKYGGFYVGNRCCYGEDTVYFARLVFNEPFMIIHPMAVRHNRQDSGLSNVLEKAIAPILTDPSLLLDYCPPEKKELAEWVLACLALRTAHHQARNGLKHSAIRLLNRFPRSRRFKARYIRCRTEIFFSFILPYWVYFKRFAGLRFRPFIKRIRRRLFGSKQDGLEESI